MKRILVLALFGTACATSGGAMRNSSAMACGIAQQPWPAASRDFDRSRSVAVIGSLKQIAAADRDHLKMGQKSDVGDSLDNLYREGGSGGFVSSGVAELGNRLRQLDCAVRAGRMNAAEAAPLYDQILGELTAERSTLEPGAARASAPMGAMFYNAGAQIFEGRGPVHRAAMRR